MWVFSSDPDHIPDIRISPSTRITTFEITTIVAFHIPDPDPDPGITDIIFIRSSETSDRADIRFVLDVDSRLGDVRRSMVVTITTFIPCLIASNIPIPISNESIADPIPIPITITPEIEYIPRSRSRKTP